MDTDMKTALNKMKIAIAATSLLASCVVMAQTETSGEGRNGPDKSGVSIPVSVDRLMSLDEVFRLERICAQDAAQEVLEQMLRQQLPAEVVGRPLQVIAIKDANSTRMLSFTLTWYSRVARTKKPGDSRIAIRFNIGQNWNSDEQSITRNDVIVRTVSTEVFESINSIQRYYTNPYNINVGLHYDYTTNTIRNSFGQETVEYLLKKLTIVGNGAVTLRNDLQKDIPTAFKINFNKYQKCIRDQLQ